MLVRHAVCVELISRDGARVALRPTGYQFSQGSASRGDWDANWLLVRGQVRTPTGRSWSFHDPCLTTWECVELLDWLTAASRGDILPSEAPAEGEGLLAFTEPNLAFSVAEISAGDLVIRVHLSLESAPSGPDQTWDLYECEVPLKVAGTELLGAAEQWRADISPYPAR